MQGHYGSIYLNLLGKDLLFNDSGFIKQEISDQRGRMHPHTCQHYSSSKESFGSDNFLLDFIALLCYNHLDFNKIEEWLSKNKIIIIKGARRTGKTTLLNQIRDYLTHSSERTIYLSVDQELNNPIFSNFNNLISLLSHQVGYFYTSGFYAIYKSLKETEKIRILIGIGTTRETNDLLESTLNKKQQSLEFSHAEAKEKIANMVEKEMEDSEDNKRGDENMDEKDINFEEMAKNIRKKIILNQKQIMVLRKIRDTLLPLLVFGKLRVEEI